jgi:adenylosuccinate lyase
MALTELLAITPVDGRYRDDVKELVPYSSEKALIQSRLKVEAQYLIALHSQGLVTFTEEEGTMLRNCYVELSDEDAQMIKDIETKGVEGINKGKKTDHDVKSLEFWMRHKFKNTSLENKLEFFHICLTSEDVNNIAYSSMLQNGVRRCIIPAQVKLVEQIIEMARTYRELPMPGRTHGQPAIPTTIGKELAVFAYRLATELKDLAEMTLKGKLNGAIGNYSAFYATFPNKDWHTFSRKFLLDNFHLEHQPYTTQIEPHDSMAEMFRKIRSFNTILMGIDQDMWQYISDEYFLQKREEGAVGSSTMPQKINPIKFENSEGNLGISNAMLGYFADKLPISRFQRDLSDSTVQRWIGTALASSLLAYKNSTRGFNKCEPNAQKLSEELDKHWEMLAEPVQQILRREGVQGAYDMLKNLTQGKRWTKYALHEFATTSGLSDSVQTEILKLTPHNYTGMASQLTLLAWGDVRKIIEDVKYKFKRCEE